MPIPNKLRFPGDPEERTRSFPFTLHAKPVTTWLSRVRRRGSPWGRMSVPNGNKNRSNELCSTNRLNARKRPSGLKTGEKSPLLAHSRGVVVSLRRSPDSTDISQSPDGCSDGRSNTTSHIPSGDQLKAAFMGSNRVTSPTTRSEPPSGGTKTTAAFPGREARKKAIELPSGDQEGAVSA